MARNKPRGRPKARRLVPHPTFQLTLRTAKQRGLPVEALWRSVNGCCLKTFYEILAGRGKCTPAALLTINVIGELLDVPRDQRAVGLVLDPPSTRLTVFALRRLSRESALAQAFATERLDTLSTLHADFDGVRLQTATEAR